MNVLRRFFRFLTSPLLWVSIAVLLLAAWIWFDGPLIAFGESLPLQSRRARALVIAVLLVIWLWWLVRRLRPRAGAAGPIARWRERRRQRREQAAADAGPNVERLVELRARLIDALTRLRECVPSTSRVAAWADRLTGRSKYRLPWIVVAGSAGSGKTSLLAGSGLRLHGPLPDGAPVPPTTQCDWWYADEAVLVDTPHDTLETRPDGTPEPNGIWATLTALLRRHRPRQPLNGVLLTVAADTLVAMAATERTACAERLARPLRALQTRLDVRVPVYVCVTRMDRLRGFSDYFRNLGHEAREAAWGIGYALSDPRPSNPLWPAHNGLAELAKRLDDGLCAALDAEPDADARALAYLFPQQFDVVRQAIASFCESLFREPRFEAPLHLRGIYFTAARNGPSTTDCVLGTPHDTPAAPREFEAATERNGFFIKALLRDVLFADTGFAGVSRTERRRNALWQTVLATCAVAMLAVLVCGWIVSYTNNRAYLNEVDARVAAFARDAAQPLEDANPQTLAPMLDALKALPDSPRFNADSPPFFRYRLGLFQGTRVREAAEDAYQRALREKLLPLVSAHLEQLLSGAPTNDIEYDYAALKAYLMLHDPAHYDGSFVAAWLSLDIQRTLPANTTQAERTQIDTHLSNLFASRSIAAAQFGQPINQALVDAVRARVAQVALPERTYRVLRRELMRTMKAAPVTFADAGGPQAALVFVRASGKPLTDGIAPLFTYRGYWDTVDKRIGEITGSLARDDAWVLGIAGAAKADGVTLAGWTEQARRLYLNEYITTWDDYLGDLRLAPAPSMQQSIQRARVLSAPDSPLRNLLQVAAKETQLLRPEAGKPQLAARWRQRMDVARHSLEAVFGKTPTDSPLTGMDAPTETLVDAHFAALRQLVAGQGPDGRGGAPLDPVLQNVDALYSYLTSASAALASGGVPPTTDVFAKLQADAGRLPVPLRGLLSDLSRNAVQGVGATTRQALSEQTSNGVGNVCRQMIAGRYPFVRNAARDMPPDEFARLFASGGVLDDYFQKNLAAQADTNGTRWRFRPVAVASTDGMGFAADAPRDARVLDAFSQAAKIRDTYFGSNGRSPAFELVLTPQETDPDILQYTLTIGAQTLRYAHGPSTPQVVKWSADSIQRVALEINTVGGPQTLQGEGPWALQRLFDKAQIAPGNTADTQNATFDVDGHKLTLRMAAGTAGGDALHRAELLAFRCPA
ncbi:type VI secretion system membrane subunit TssM [Paraburkholderia silviterrae]|uniref:Type VI secretion system membrane subunit TssM n=1 Tax=Paraburkholderia silviterrae TaxID=2528715 RepID=A0A4R5MAT7_9BURK|nr:type VI secretion system membrane subunit TssM [Paraburkholderia silviterrae]TDG23813.1 type VI secretion system membrane subunit TssM [Paraburkholderia silviterrae]